MSKDNYLEKYAKAIAKVGINVKENDNIIINTDVNSLPLVRLISNILWEHGANDVIVKIDDKELSRIAYEKASLHSLGTVENFKTDYAIALMEKEYHRMSISSAYPDYFSKIKQENLKVAQQANAIARKPLQKYMDKGNIKWVVAATASPYWANLLFPDLPEKKAVDKLWELIFLSCHIDENDPVENWLQHNQKLKSYENWLNEQNFEYLQYNGPGTKLKVYLADKHRWIGGSSTAPNGVEYMANMPTEEIFTTPHMQKVDGYVTSTKPLSIMGKMIEEFTFEFKDGKVVNFNANENHDVLETLFETDENSTRLGEVAIVPNSSPISKTNTLFRSTLFDENASCHFALGQSYAETIVNGENLSEAEKEKLGANHSMIHVDFMIGSENLNILGVRNDGIEIPILTRGEWAFELENSLGF